MTANTTVTPFSFNTHAVRVIVRDGNPWFVAKDVCDTLGYSNSRSAIADHLDDDERSTVANPDGRNGGGVLTIINESGLYALVLRSRKPEARKFAKWVTSEVLPAIRKTGKYETPYSVHPHQTLSAQQAQALRDLISTTAKTMPKEVQAEFTIKAWSKLKSHFKVAYRDIPAHEYEEAVSIIARHIDAYSESARMPQFITIDRFQLESLWFDLGQLRERLNAMASDPRLAHQGEPLGA